MWSSWPWVSTMAVDVVEAVPDVVEVRQDQVDAGLEVLGEQHAAVDDQQPAGVLEDGHVAADLAEAAERDDAQPALGELGRRPELGVRVAHAGGPESLAQRADLVVGGVAAAARRTVRSGDHAGSCSAALARITPCEDRSMIARHRGDQPAVDRRAPSARSPRSTAATIAA